MNRHVFRSLLLGLALLPFPAAHGAGIANGTVSQGFTFRDGSWWRGGVAFTRSTVCVRGCNSFVFRRRAVAKVVVQQKVIQAAVPVYSANWKTELVKLLEKEKDSQYFLESIKAAGLGSRYGNYQASSYATQGSTVYGYNSIASFYGDNNPSVLYQQAARLARNSQDLAGQATTDFSALVGRDGDARANVASILAAGQAIREARTGAQVTSSSVSIGTAKDAGVPTPAPAETEPEEPDGDAGAMRSVPHGNRSAGLPASSAKCASCHHSGNEAKVKGLVLAPGRTFSAIQLLAIAGRTANGSMPPRGSPQLTAEEKAEWANWVYNRSKQMKLEQKR